MVEVLRGVNAVVFLLLGGIHLYWVLGGLWGTNYAIPSTAEEIPVFQPRKIGTSAVAICLVLAALANFRLVDLGSWSSLVIGILFGLRVIGDFKYVGLGKKVKKTPFAQKDATVFVPLCIYLSLSHFFLFFWQ